MGYSCLKFSHFQKFPCFDLKQLWSHQYFTKHVWFLTSLDRNNCLMAQIIYFGHCLVKSKVHFEEPSFNRCRAFISIFLTSRNNYEVALPFHWNHTRLQSVHNHLPSASTLQFNYHFLPLTCPCSCLSQQDFSLVIGNYSSQSFPHWTLPHISSLKSYSATHQRWIKSANQKFLKDWSFLWNFLYINPETFCEENYLLSLFRSSAFDYLQNVL